MLQSLRQHRRSSHRVAKMYEQAQAAQGAAGAGPDMNAGAAGAGPDMNAGASNGADDDVIDADFKEV
jgi:molecular chaperone DnaK